MPRQTSTEVKLEFICRELRDLKDEQKQLRAAINQGRGAIWLLLIIAGLVSGFYNYFR